MKGSVAERSFEANVYYQMVNATVAAEKLGCVTAHLEGIQGLLAEQAQLDLLKETVQEGDVVLPDADMEETQLQPPAVAELQQ